MKRDTPRAAFPVPDTTAVLPFQQWDWEAVVPSVFSGTAGPSISTTLPAPSLLAVETEHLKNGTLATAMDLSFTLACRESRVR